MRKSICGALAAAVFGISLLVAVAPAAPTPQAGHHYLIDTATGAATDIATGQLLAAATAESLLIGSVAQGGPAGAKVTMSAKTGTVLQASPATAAFPAGTCLSLSPYFTIWRGLPHAPLC